MDTHRGLSGWNMPGHQQVISNFIFGIRTCLYEKHDFRWVVVPECPIRNRNLKEKVIPDILVWDEENGSADMPALLIEVCRKKGMEKDIKKVKQLLKLLPSLQEAFVYNYETNEGFRYTKAFYKTSGNIRIEEGDGETVSAVLDMDLSTCTRG